MAAKAIGRETGQGSSWREDPGIRCAVCVETIQACLSTADGVERVVGEANAKHVSV